MKLGETLKYDEMKSASKRLNFSKVPHLQKLLNKNAKFKMQSFIKFKNLLSPVTFASLEDS